MPMTLHELLQTGDDGSTAITAPGRKPLSYAVLRDHAQGTRAAITRAGIGPAERVAIVLPNGPEMATSFIGTALAATAAPLNPAYTAAEFRYYLQDLDAAALITERGGASSAGQVARALGIRVLELSVPPDAPAGVFELGSETGNSGNTDPGQAGPDDTALVLHTSGTTARPKIVPLSHANLASSAAHVAAALALDHDDVTLGIMPLFHIHGLIATLLASLSSGGSVYCTPGFNALKFFAWLDDAAPSWYSAVPTMHQAILGRASRNVPAVERGRLRLVRSSSASLAPTIMAELERVFGCPVIESYGMTEAAHQMTSNPLPPEARKPGTVGRTAGPEVAVMDEHDTLLPPGETGEIVIRGPNVTAGYANNPSANAESFSGGWFRTGDQGHFDRDGYLSISRRLKEQINRGGEKIAPREVDEALLEHPAVAQAVTFALPDDRLGEEVGAAIVLEEGSTVSDREIRDFARTRLAAFKVPRKVVFVDEIPKGATGKLMRIGLHEKLGL